MRITFLGHAGFCVETQHAIIVMDPWVSPDGAFDASWFQYPKNHHMAEYIRSILATPDKQKFIYISHEHKDHFDLDFLMSLKTRDFTIILAAFYHNMVKNDLHLKQYACLDILILQDNQAYQFVDGTITLLVVDMELDADSAILVKTSDATFLNLNDSKPHDRLAEIVQHHGTIDVLAGQFSGAIWHPTCYKMDLANYAEVCRNKIINKFETVVQSLEILNPAAFLPSAGPPCFLDPMLYPIQLQAINTYPRAKQLIDFLNAHYQDKKIRTCWDEMMPGDVFDVPSKQFLKLAEQRVTDEGFISYIHAYANEYSQYFQKRAVIHARVDPVEVFLRLGEELAVKLERMKLVHQQIETKLYFALTEYPQQRYCVDFQQKRLLQVLTIADNQQYFSIVAPAWQVNKVLLGEISWSDFALTFRVSLERVPETYNTLSHAFLTLDADRLEHFCQLFHEILAKKERIQITWQDKTYSMLRYCPHQGGDLAHAVISNGIVTCPRHCWKFDLNQQGRCLHNNTHIDAICLSDETV